MIAVAREIRKELALMSAAGNGTDAEFKPAAVEEERIALSADRFRPVTNIVGMTSPTDRN